MVKYTKFYCRWVSVPCGSLMGSIHVGATIAATITLTGCRDDRPVYMPYKPMHATSALPQTP